VGCSTGGNGGLTSEVTGGAIVSNLETECTYSVKCQTSSMAPSYPLLDTSSRLNSRVPSRTMATSHTASDDTQRNEAVSSAHIIYSEILSVTSVMRKNSRWSSTMQTFYTRDSALASNLGLRRPGSNIASTPQQGSREEDLMSGFEELKRSLRSAQGMCNISDAWAFGIILMTYRFLHHSPH
jgi:hypothetical protein